MGCANHGELEGALLRCAAAALYLSVITRLTRVLQDVVLNATKKTESPGKKEEEKPSSTEKARPDKDGSTAAARGIKRPRLVYPPSLARCTENNLGDLHREAALAKPQLKIAASEEFDDLIAGPSKRPVTETRKLQGLIPDRTNRFSLPPDWGVDSLTNTCGFRREAEEANRAAH